MLSIPCVNVGRNLFPPCISFLSLSSFNVLCSKGYPVLSSIFFSSSLSFLHVSSLLCTVTRRSHILVRLKQSTDCTASRPNARHHQYTRKATDLKYQIKQLDHEIKMVFFVLQHSSTPAILRLIDSHFPQSESTTSNSFALPKSNVSANKFP